MGKTRQEKIASYEERIAQLENQKKMEQQRLRAEERKKRDRRLYKRAGILESLLPETIPLTDEQFHTFLHRTVANTFGRDKLNQIIAEGEKPSKTSSKPGKKTDSNNELPDNSDSTGEDSENLQDSTGSGA